MSRVKRGVWVMGGVLVALSLVVILWFASGQTVELSLTEGELQEALEKRFPVEKTHLKLFTFRYSNPVVKLEEGTDRIHAGVDAEASFSSGGEPLSGTARISGTLRYDPATGEFRLADSRVEQLDIAGFPERHRALLKAVATFLLKERLDDHPVYRLEATDFKHAVARVILKSVEVKDRRLKVVLGLR